MFDLSSALCLTIKIIMSEVSLAAYWVPRIMKSEVSSAVCWTVKTNDLVINSANLVPYLPLCKVRRI
jgi:hypothetical protein